MRRRPRKDTSLKGSLNGECKAVDLVIRQFHEHKCLGRVIGGTRRISLEQKTVVELFFGFDAQHGTLPGQFRASAAHGIEIHAGLLELADIDAAGTGEQYPAGYPHMPQIRR
jgi:hypothetical protein